MTSPVGDSSHRLKSSSRSRSLTTEEIEANLANSMGPIFSGSPRSNRLQPGQSQASPMRGAPPRSRPKTSSSVQQQSKQSGKSNGLKRGPSELDNSTSPNSSQSSSRADGEVKRSTSRERNTNRLVRAWSGGTGGNRSPPVPPTLSRPTTVFVLQRPNTSYLFNGPRASDGGGGGIKAGMGDTSSRTSPEHSTQWPSCDEHHQLEEVVAWVDALEAELESREDSSSDNGSDSASSTGGVDGDQNARPSAYEREKYISAGFLEVLRQMSNMKCGCSAAAGPLSALWKRWYASVTDRANESTSRELRAQKERFAREVTAREHDHHAERERLRAQIGELQSQLSIKSTRLKKTAEVLSAVQDNADNELVLLGRLVSEKDKEIGQQKVEESKYKRQVFEAQQKQTIERKETKDRYEAKIAYLEKELGRVSEAHCRAESSLASAKCELEENSQLIQKLEAERDAYEEANAVHDANVWEKRALRRLSSLVTHGLVVTAEVKENPPSIAARTTLADAEELISTLLAERRVQLTQSLHADVPFPSFVLSFFLSRHGSLRSAEDAITRFLYSCEELKDKSSRILWFTRFCANRHDASDHSGDSRDGVSAKLHVSSLASALGDFYAMMENELLLHCHSYFRHGSSHGTTASQQWISLDSALAVVAQVLSGWSPIVVEDVLHRLTACVQSRGEEKVEMMASPASYQVVTHVASRLPAGFPTTASSASSTLRGTTQFIHINDALHEVATTVLNSFQDGLSRAKRAFRSLHSDDVTLAQFQSIVTEFSIREVSPEEMQVLYAQSVRQCMDNSSRVSDVECARVVTLRGCMTAKLNWNWSHSEQHVSFSNGGYVDAKLVGSQLEIKIALGGETFIHHVSPQSRVLEKQRENEAERVAIVDKKWRKAQQQMEEEFARRIDRLTHVYRSEVERIDAVYKAQLTEMQAGADVEKSALAANLEEVTEEFRSFKEKAQQTHKHAVLALKGDTKLLQAELNHMHEILESRYGLMGAIEAVPIEGVMWRCG